VRSSAGGNSGSWSSDTTTTLRRTLRLWEDGQRVRRGGDGRDCEVETSFVVGMVG